MPSSLVITVSSDRSEADLARFVKDTTDPRGQAKVLQQYFERVASGTELANWTVQTGDVAPVAASGTLTLVSAVATDAVTVGATTFTATSTPSLATDWEIDGASDALDAASLAAAINANTTANKLVTATVASNVVTITAKQKGIVGNFIPLTSADATITASGSGLLAGGLGGAKSAVVTYSRGR
jgi:phage tail sheath gpL-like